MKFKVGDLVRVIQAADQSLWERSHVGQIGIIVEITYLTHRPRYKVFIEEHFAVFHSLDLEPLKNEDR